MKDTPALDDLALFIAICDAGGLAGAVPVTGQSAPTLSRKMTALERQTGRRLFERGNKGYALTSDGRDLRHELADLPSLRTRIEAWMSRDLTARVRITAGTWTSWWLALHLKAYWTPSAIWVPEFMPSNATLDLARREADLGFRNRRPEQSWLAGRRIRKIEYASFAISPEVKGYVTLAADLPGTPSTRYIHEHHSAEIVTTVTDTRLALDLAQQGIARVALPTFAGRAAKLSQVSEVHQRLTHDEWLVTHHDARHDTPVRAAISAITGFVEQER